MIKRKHYFSLNYSVKKKIFTSLSLSFFLGMEHVDTFKEKGKTNYDYASVSLINHSIVGT